MMQRFRSRFIHRFLVVGAALLLPVALVPAVSQAATGAPPTVSVGADQLLTLGDTAFLRGRVSDDGLPDPSALDVAWEVVSGPGEVTFGGRGEAHTTADFSAVGDYELQLSASDGGGSASDALTVTVRDAASTTIRVPEDHATIQAALDAAPANALVLVSPGTYQENLYIPRTLTLASTFYTTGDPARVKQTVISAADSEAETVLISSSAGADTRVVGFTVRDGKDGIKVRGAAVVEHNILTALGTDAVDFPRDTAGLVQHNVMRGNGDDAVDVNESSTVIVDNLMEHNEGDGIEIRTTNMTAPVDEVIIRDNRILANVSDGIQIIDDDPIAAGPAQSATLFVIDRNVIADNAQAGLGLMDNGDTTEDYRGADLVERISVTGNTFDRNHHGITGGDNLVALNNIFANHAAAALKDVDGTSEVAYNQFFANGAPNAGSNVDAATSFSGDPELDAGWAPLPGSPVIDAGVDSYSLASGEQVLDIQDYDGAGPDLGAIEFAGSTGGNRRPVVDAGADVSVVQPAQAALAGSVTDDGLPAGSSLSVQWTKDSGPGAVAFGDPTSLSTSASFSEPGSYVLRLTADDGEFSGADVVAVSVTPEAGALVDVESRVSADDDDAEERPDGSVSLTSSDLELGADGSRLQTVGMRFPGLDIPQGASVVSASIQFQADEVSSGTASLSLAAQDIDDAAPFTNSSGDVSGRAWAGSVPWEPGAWSATGDRGAEQRTPDLAELVQQVVARPGWQPGNALAFAVTGSGTRTAEAFEGEGPVTALHVTYVMPGAPDNQAPVVDAGADLSVELPAEASLVGSVTDDGLPAGGSVSVQWAMDSGPGTVTFEDPTSLSTSASFSEPGSYVLQLTADDGELSADDTVTVTVSPEPAEPPEVVAVESRVSAGDDDAEERAGGRVSMSSSDLEMVTDKSQVQTVGLRFPGLEVPRGATVVSAWIQFQADETSSVATSLDLAAQDVDDAAPFTSSTGDVSGRAWSGSVPWTPVAWESKGERAEAQVTPDVAELVQQVVSRPGWTVGNAMAFAVTGSGVRTADSFEGAGSVTALHVEYTMPAETGNQRPVVDAGADMSVELPAQASLEGSVTDDGLPAGSSLSVEWKEVSGPAAVTFGDPTSSSTSASFSEPGSYVLRLTADDGELTGNDTLEVSVMPEAGALVEVESRVSAGDDDAEERASGRVSMSSSDLEMVTDGSQVQTVGVRFPGLEVPQGATVVSAWIQFQADEASSVATSLDLAAQDVDDAAPFTSSSGDVSGRAWSGSVPWTPVAWESKGERAEAQVTPDLAALVQQVVSRPGWTAGNAMAFAVTGSGVRTADSFEGAGPVTALHVEYTMP